MYIEIIIGILIIIVKYERIHAEDLSEIRLTMAGKYLITSKRISQTTTVVKSVIIADSLVAVVPLGIYIAVKKVLVLAKNNESVGFFLRYERKTENEKNVCTIYYELDYDKYDFLW